MSPEISPLAIPCSTTHCVVLFTKPAQPGKVKTRLIGELDSVQAAELHSAFLGDVCACVREAGDWLRVAWAEDDPRVALPIELTPGAAEHVRQRGADLGQRLGSALAAAAVEFETVLALGSDHPELEPKILEQARQRLAAGCDVVLGPSVDGGYYLIGLRAEKVRQELFRDIAWSTAEVLEQTLGRCRQLGLRSELLPIGHDVDVAADLLRLQQRLRSGYTGCPRTRRLLQSWGRLGEESS